MTGVAWSASGRAPITPEVIPAKFASIGEGSMEVENEAPTAAKPPISPATGWRPAAANTSAARGGITTNEVSLMRFPLTPTKATTYGSSQRGADPKSPRIAALSRPEPSAMPTARTIGSTFTRGGKPM